MEAYELVEQVRKLSVAFRRDADQDADRALKKLLKSLSGDQTVSVIRAFTYFSHPNLAKTATTSAAARRARTCGRYAEGSIEGPCRACAGLYIAPKTISQRWPQSYVAPVLTAHPTEVQRKSILDAERDIAQLLAVRDLHPGARPALQQRPDAPPA